MSTRLLRNIIRTIVAIIFSMPIHFTPTLFYSMLFYSVILPSGHTPRSLESKVGEDRILAPPRRGEGRGGQEKGRGGEETRREERVVVREERRVKRRLKVVMKDLRTQQRRAVSTDIITNYSGANRGDCTCSKATPYSTIRYLL